MRNPPSSFLNRAFQSFQVLFYIYYRFKSYHCIFHPRFLIPRQSQTGYFCWKRGSIKKNLTLLFANCAQLGNWQADCSVASWINLVSSVVPGVGRGGTEGWAAVVVVAHKPVVVVVHDPGVGSKVVPDRWWRRKVVGPEVSLRFAGDERRQDQRHKHLQKRAFFGEKVVKKLEKKMTYFERSHGNHATKSLLGNDGRFYSRDASFYATRSPPIVAIFSRQRYNCAYSMFRVHRLLFYEILKIPWFFFFFFVFLPAFDARKRVGAQSKRPPKNIHTSWPRKTRIGWLQTPEFLPLRRSKHLYCFLFHFEGHDNILSTRYFSGKGRPDTWKNRTVNPKNS